MTWFTTLLLAAGLALAGGDDDRAEKKRRGKLQGPPLRVGSFGVLRGGTTAALGFELSTQVFAKERTGVELGGAVSTVQRVDNFEPLRQMTHASLLVDGVYALTETINVGPTLGLTFRTWRQEWMAVGNTRTPVLGVRATSGLLTARTWQFHLTVRGTVDVLRTRMVFATAEVRELNPWELQIGARWLFARRRSPRLGGGDR